MKIFKRSLLVLLAIMMITSVIALPASAVSDGKWDTGYNLVNSDGKAAGSDTFYISAPPFWAPRTVYVKKICGSMAGMDKEIAAFYKEVTLSVKIYNCNTNKIVKQLSVKTGGSFSMPKAFSIQKYRVIITKDVPKSVRTASVKQNHNFLNYSLSTNN